MKSVDYGNLSPKCSFNAPSLFRTVWVGCSFGTYAVVPYLLIGWCLEAKWPPTDEGVGQGTKRSTVERRLGSNIILVPLCYCYIHSIWETRLTDNAQTESGGNNYNHSEDMP